MNYRLYSRIALNLSLQISMAGLLAFPLIAAAPATNAPVKTSDFVPVGPQNLAGFAAKVRSKQPVVIAYLGGSITVGSGASPGHGYRNVAQAALTKEIERRGGKATMVTSATGGTPSSFGAFRVSNELLSQHPDLLVVEYAVNDYGGVVGGADGVAKVVDAMEGIVRQALRSNPAMGIVLFYTTNVRQQEESYDKGLISASALAHHRVASHYGLMEVLTGPTVSKEIAEGKYTYDLFFRDKTHPLDMGAALYAKILVDAIIPALDLPLSAPRPLPALLGTGAFEYARMDSVAVGDSGWTVGKGNCTLTCVEAGKPLHFTTKGTNIALVYKGRIKLNWTVGGKAQEKTVTAQTGVPFPGNFRFDPAPDATGVTVEAVAGDDGVVKSEVLGVTSIQAP